MEAHDRSRRSARSARRSRSALDLQPRGRGADLDRLVNARHSPLHEAVARSLAQRLPGLGPWPTRSRSTSGASAGSSTCVLWHPARRALLIIELKTELVDLGRAARDDGSPAAPGARIVARPRLGSGDRLDLGHRRPVTTDERRLSTLRIDAARPRSRWTARSPVRRRSLGLVRRCRRRPRLTWRRQRVRSGQGATRSCARPDRPGPAGLGHAEDSRGSGPRPARRGAPGLTSGAETAARRRGRRCRPRCPSIDGRQGRSV